MLQKLHLKVSAVIVDEAAHSSEMETMMSIMANVRMAHEGRIHAVLVGDSQQLGPVFLSAHESVMFVSKNRDFQFPYKMKQQFESLFSRLHRTDRCRMSWLTHHYRTYPLISQIVLSFMYRDILLFPRPMQQFAKPYNSVAGPNGLQPLTIIDTRPTYERFEGVGDGSVASSGKIINECEAEILNDVLFRIFDNSGNCNLDNDIIVCSPYADQSAFLRPYLTTRTNGRANPRFLSASNQAPQLNVIVENIDALQGSERSIVVISLTKSNMNGFIGFLTDNGRLNVAFSRPKDLLVVIEDFSTLRNSPCAAYVYNKAWAKEPGTSLQFYEASHPEMVDIVGVREMQRSRR